MRAAGSRRLLPAALLPVALTLLLAGPAAVRAQEPSTPPPSGPEDVLKPAPSPVPNPLEPAPVEPGGLRQGDARPAVPEPRVPGLGSSQGQQESSSLFGIPGRNITPLAGPVDPAQYHLGPGDVLLLEVWGRLSQSSPLEVSPEGTLMIPNIGTLFVDGRTLTEVRKDVLARLHRKLIGIEMDLRLARPRVFRAYLTGQIRDPGPVDVTGTQRAGDVITPGTLGRGASRRHIDVLHRDGTREDCDLDLFLVNGDTSLNPYLRDGDILRVPAATEYVWAEGAIAVPGRFELGVRDSLRTLLRLAGDPLPAADVDRVLLIHFENPLRPDSTWFNLSQIYARRTNPALHDGDRLYVYFIPQYHQQHEASITGEVRRPGVYPIVEGQTRLSYMVQQAYGFLPSADLSAIRVHRKNPVAPESDPELQRLLRLSRNELTATEYGVLQTKLAGAREDYRVDWSRVQGNAALDLLLRDGDVIRVERLVSSIRVDGEVRRPGIVNYVPGRGVEDYIRQTGGYTDRAWTGKVRVTRAVTGQTLLARNVRALDPGDLVWVPEKPDVTTWEQAREVLTALASIATVIIAIRSIR